jgi:hypothetical protein
MNVKGPGQPSPPDVLGPEGDGKLQPKSGSKIEDSASIRGAAKPGQSFAETVNQPRQVAAATDSPVVTRVSDVSVKDLAADLDAGRLTPSGAIDKILDRVLARQVGPEAPAAVREQVRMALQEAIASDPMLADKLRQLD